MVDWQYVLNIVVEIVEFWTAGTFRSIYLSKLAGIVIGRSRTASRQIAEPLMDEDSLSTWALEQARLVNKMNITVDAKEMTASLIRSLGGETDMLPIAMTTDGWMSFKDIIRKKDWPTEIIVLNKYFWDTVNDIDNDYELLLNVIAATKWGLGSENIKVGSKHIKKAEHKEWEHIFRTNYGAVIEALALAWGVSLQEVLESSDFSDGEHEVKRPFAEKSDGKTRKRK